ncbi:MAG: SDR family oxidoreductase [Tannerellaceae bacterium]|jgi:3-oxoacyl-[acyl-carrier protein] reductase|nr:SDR family oxidoreductase [Tannerellaceae bacterium]
MNNSSTKHILITGGTKGIGLAVARVMARSGYDLLLTYWADEPAALKARRELSEGFAVEVALLRADVGEKESVGRITGALREMQWTIDALIFNAGLTYRCPFEAIRMEEWERVFFGNVHFPVFLLQQMLGEELLRRGGSVVFTGSAMGEHPHAASLAYGVGKSAVHALTKNLVKFLAPYNIRVNAIAPGFVDTDWQKSKKEELRASIAAKISLQRFCRPEEIAELYLLAIEHSYLNGSVISADGGYSFR